MEIIVDCIGYWVLGIGNWVLVFCFEIETFEK
jgi:hypothetical protein